MRSMNLSSSAFCNVKVAVLGAAGGIGQPLALLLKHSPMITQLACYDLAPFTAGVAADLSHIETPCQVTAYTSGQLEECVTGSSLVVIPAGMPRKPGMSRDDLFNTNAQIAYDLADTCARICPDAIVAFITNPVNSTVPIACEVYNHYGVFNPNKIFGISTLDVVRANQFVAELKKMDVTRTNVPVIGGHSGITILPVLSHVIPRTNFSDEEIESLTERIQNAGTEVVEAKAGAGSATLSMAYAGARFSFSLLEALGGKKGVVECAYVHSSVITGTPYFASPVLLGEEGIERHLGHGVLSDYEREKLEALLPELQANIAKGVTFARERIAEKDAHSQDDATT